MTLSVRVIQDFAIVAQQPVTHRTRRASPRAMGLG
ncbi:MAG: hypothetical protein BMS9Abin37_2212 [Acidobacteriota bacterium]|nr:MAG: hypothetical protein BMS9Abin37_2212 [Acidobacteriota bacterium]